MKYLVVGMTVTITDYSYDYDLVIGINYEIPF